MVTIELQIPEDVCRNFNIAFPAEQRNTVITELMRRAVAEAGVRKQKQAHSATDPLWTLGEEPVEDSGLTDASVNHDRYLYQS